MEKRPGSRVLVIIEIAALVVIAAMSGILFVKNGNKVEAQLAQASSTATQNTVSDSASKAKNVELIKFDEEIEEKIASMTLEEKVFQLFLVTPEDYVKRDEVKNAGPVCQATITDYPIGGIACSGLNFLGADNTKEKFAFLNLYSNNRIGTDLIFAIDANDENSANFLTDEYIEEQGLLVINNETKIEGLTISAPIRDEDTSKLAKAVVDAIIKGKHMIYLPSGFNEVYETVIAAVDDGTISDTLLHNSVGKILTAKKKLAEDNADTINTQQDNNTNQQNNNNRQNNNRPQAQQPQAVPAPEDNNPVTEPEPAAPEENAAPPVEEPAPPADTPQDAPADAGGEDAPVE